MFVFDIALSQPNVAEVMKGFVPTAEIVQNPEMLYIALGILGATVMPHNLYLHSSIVQTRDYERTTEGKRSAIRYATWDSSIALMLALFVNAAILIVSAATFHTVGREVSDIEAAYELLGPMLGTGAASIVFGVALLASGQFNAYRYACGTDCYGGLSEYTTKAMVKTPYNTADCHYSGCCCDGYLWRTRNS